MRLVAEWRAVLRYAWSIRLLIIAGLLSGLEVALPILDEFIPIPRGVFAGLSACVVAVAFIARLIAQKTISGENNADQ